MADRELQMNPSDLAGALHRNLMEAATYILQTPAMNIDMGGVRGHLDRANDLIDALQDLQQAVRAHAASNASANANEARAN